MKIKFRFDIDDAIAYSKWCSESDPAQRRPKKLFRIVAPLMLPLALGKSWLDGALDWGLIWSGLALVALAYGPLHLLNAWQLRRLYSKKQNSIIFGAIELELREHDLVSIGPVGRGELRLESVQSAVVTDDHGFIVIPMKQAYAIPRSKIIEGDLEQFMRALSDRAQAARARARPS